MTKPGVKRDDRWGFLRLDPLPTRAELDAFYNEAYYGLIQDGQRAPDLARLMAGGPDAEAEQAWLKQTIHADFAALAQTHAPGKRLLEIGCGLGELLDVFRDHGFETEGIEPSLAGSTKTAARGHAVHHATLEECLPKLSKGQYDVVVLNGVIEHLLEPWDAMAAIEQLLAPRGVLMVRITNDFSPLQQAAQQVNGKAPWWVAAPDKINYFDAQTLTGFIGKFAFDVVHSQGDFPMEFFILLGFDYVGDKVLGPECHRRRRQFELSLPPETRRALYAKLAEVNMGRSVLAVARRR